MVRTRSMAAVVRSRNLIKTKAAPPKSKLKAAQPMSKRRAAQLKRAAAAEEEEKMMEAFRAVDVEKILRLKQEAFEAMETKCFPSTARANQAAAEARARLAAARGQSGAEQEEKVPEKKKKVVTYLVCQGYIDGVKAGHFNIVDEIPEDKLAKESQIFRDTYRRQVLLNDKIRACQQFLLDQYDTYGYAFDAMEVTDDEAEDDEEGIGAEEK